ncbi:MAG: non-heme iron oxygenase ferredoxin subunit [Nevskia sp.]
MTEPDWTDVAALDEVPEGEAVGIERAGRNLALYRVEGAVYATDNLCTHGAARLCEGFVDGHEIECPLHQGRFDLRSGRAMRLPAKKDLRCYAVRIDAGRVLLALD